jgi:hypothetical protein
MLKKTNCSVPLADVNWDNFAPVKVKVFFWVFRHNNARHGVLAIDHCPFCLDASEDTDHLFFQCPRVAAFWTHVCHDAPPPRNIEEPVACVPLPPGQLRNTYVLLLIWLSGLFGKAATRWSLIPTTRTCRR